MMGAVTPETCRDFEVNKYLHTVASGWIFINTEEVFETTRSVTRTVQKPKEI